MFQEAFGSDPENGVQGAWLDTEWLAGRARMYGSRDQSTRTHGLDPADDRRGPNGTPDRTCPDILDSHVLGSMAAWGWPQEWASRGFCSLVARKS